MRAAILVLALLLPAAVQEAPDLLKSCEALYDPLTSLQPESRSRAHADLVKLTSGKREFLKTPVLPSPQIVLTLLGDAAAGKEAAKVVAEEPGPFTRIAVEALSHVATDPSADRLFKLLDSEDLRIAMAAARALARVKNPANAQALVKLADQIDNPRRKVLATYALELTEPNHLATIVNQADSTSQPVREVAWAALANLPTAVEEVRRRLLEKDGTQTWSNLFESQVVPDEVRDAFGRLLVKSGLYVGPDLVDLGTHKIKEVAAWARSAALDPLLMRKSVLIASLLKRLAAYENEADQTKEPIPWLEVTLAAQGIKGEGDKLKDRLESARLAWERMRPSVLDKDVNAAIDAGVALLKSRQDPTGYWKYCVCGAQKNDNHNNGTTALCVYTLLKCDVPVRDKSITLGLDWLLNQTLPNHTYTVGLQSMVFAEAIEMLTPPPKSKVKISPEDLAALNKYLPRLRDCVTWLVEAETHVNRGGYESGDWDYAKPPGTNMDNSNTQFAVLGLRAAQNAGVPAPSAAWVRSLNHWNNDQNKDGSWPYRRDKNNANPGGTRSMTAAGLYCSLVAKATLKRKAPETLVSE
ncbi:MAG TPA: HEAT repeat domain-containing protein, partial [Planctomycetota bacterium]|nr:HEAT repeat domain-containing protein [Planctomycetota bacterium]